MDFRKLISDIFTGNTADLKKRFALLWRRMRRFFYSWSHSKLTTVDLRKIPVIINNRNRYTYLTQLIEWLENAGLRNIIILDNESSYPPLLNYYHNSPHKVVHLGRNVGPRALWESSELKYLLSDYYIYTDADVLPDASQGINIVEIMYEALLKNITLDKVGLALRIDDLPDYFALKKDVIEWESQFWKRAVNDAFFIAAVDTTFALYAPFAQGGGECKAWRTNFPAVAQHLPWYENSSAPNEENEYYRNHAAPLSSHWTELTMKK